MRNGLAAALVFAFGLTAAAARADGITDGNAGREALLAGKVDEAIRLFTHALTFGGLAAKNQAITLNLRANAYLAKGQTEVALDDVNESLRVFETPDAHFTRAKVFIAQFRFDDAAQELDRTMAMGSQAADVWALRGYAKLYGGHLPDAIKDLDQSIKLAPDYGLAWRTRGHAYLDMGQDDKAIADETKAIALDAKDVEAHWLRAYAWRWRKKEPAKAIADYTEALKVDPNDSSTRTGRADTYEELGRYAEAEADYDIWIKQNPRGPFGYWARGRLELVLGKTGEAASDLAKAVSLKPTDAYDVLWLHLARDKAGTNDAAELQANAAKANRAIWPGPVLDYLTGKIDAAAVMAKANQGDGKARATQLCEANLFLGQDDLAKGRRSEGLDRLQAGARICDGDSREGRLIKADLHGERAIMPATTLASESGPRPARPRPQLQAQASTDPLGLRGSLK